MVWSSESLMSKLPYLWECLLRERRELHEVAVEVAERRVLVPPAVLEPLLEDCHGLGGVAREITVRNHSQRSQCA